MNYYGNDRNGQSLQHWKYIDKKRVNGKWVYYYDDKATKLDKLGDKIKDKLGVDEKEAHDKAQKQAEQVYGKKYDSMAEAGIDASIYNDKALGYFAKKMNASDDAEKERAAKEERKYLIKRDTAENVIKTHEDFSKTPLGKVTAVAEVGKAVVNKLFGGLFKKKKK